MDTQAEEEFLKLLVRGRRPSVLYHYTTGDGLLGILKDRGIWATDIRYLNDASEYKYALEIVSNAISDRKAKARSKFSFGLLDVLEQRIASETQTEVFVSSFSERSDQLSQWRAYCSPHGGYAIGIESRKLVPLSEVQGRWLVRCQYERFAQETLANDLIDLVIQSAEYEDATGLVDRIYREGYKLFGRLVHLLAPSLKDPSFAEEQEWRLVWLPDTTQDSPMFRVSRSILVPYHLHPLALNDAKLPIPAVVVGPTQHAHLAVEAIKTLLGSYRLHSTKVEASKVPYRTW